MGGGVLQTFFNFFTVNSTDGYERWDGVLRGAGFSQGGRDLFPCLGDFFIEGEWVAKPVGLGSVLGSPCSETFRYGR